MNWVRRHLRAGTAVWLLGYAVSFTALVPRDCCAAHAHRSGASAAAHAGHAAPCHDAAPSVAEGAHCPMPADAEAAGAACPMHDGGSAAPEDCQLTGLCNVPAAALAAVLMSAGVPVSPFALSAPSLDGTSDVFAVERLVSRLTPPDAPPPRL